MNCKWTKQNKLVLCDGMMKDDRKIFTAVNNDFLLHFKDYIVYTVHCTKTFTKCRGYDTIAICLI